MNLKLKMYGLSARRKAIDKMKSIAFRLRHAVKRGVFWALVVGTTMLCSSCHEKSNAQNSDLKSSTASVARDSLDKPKVNIQVNKHYDDKGNLVGFDSTYSSYYSSVKGDTSKMDSLMHRFDRYFNTNHLSFFNNEFNALFFKDSLRYPDFFHEDFFRKRYEMNDAYFKDMMQRMDSVKNKFYREQSAKGNKKLK
jgi:hypothetical protein